ncbi:MAG: Ig-like domain-containing domain [Cytophagaceae bacterium]
MDKILAFFFLIAIAIILKSCANVMPPTGGPQDTEPPQVNYSIPESGQINYKYQRIEMEFDEDINLFNIQDQLLITPLTDIEFDAVARKNRLFIQFHEPFEENTTYILNFRDAIRDRTENNITPNLKLIFSTGPYLDSIEIKGKVLDHLTNQPIPNINVNLYHSDDTLTIENHRPLYLTKTDENGEYKITNIKNGIYDLYALEDKTNTMLYEKENERIAFKKGVDLNTNQEEDLSIARFITRPPRIINRMSKENRFNITFNKGVESLEIEHLEEPEHEFIYYPAEDGKNYILFNTVQHEDSVPVRITAIDSSLNVLTDTINIIFDTQKKELTQEVIKEILPTDRKLHPNNPEISIKFNKPVKTVNSDSIIITLDTIIQNIDVQNFIFNKYRNELKITGIKKITDTLALYIGSTAFITMAEDTNTTKSQIFTAKNPESHGLMSGRVETSDPHFIIELLNSRFQVIDTLRNQNKYSFDFLEPGQYQLRYIKDTNNNGRWDSGNLEEQRQPEQVFFYKDVINLRANWEMRDLVFRIEEKKEQ